MPLDLSDIQVLPRLAQLALGARCVYRLLPFANEDRWIYRNCSYILHLIERHTSLEAISTLDFDRSSDELMKMYNKIAFENIPGSENLSDITRQATMLVCEATIDDALDQYFAKLSSLKILLAVKLSWEAIKKYSDTFEHEQPQESIINDFMLLKNLSKEYKWDDDSLISQRIFPLNLIFSQEINPDNISVLDVALDLRKNLNQKEFTQSGFIYKLSPREFEVLVAEILKKIGFDVSLTAQTRDGGYDIIAIDNKLFHSKYLIECKRYASTKNVGIAVVQRLHGVVQDNQATKGILVTTSRLTQTAAKFISKHQWQLEAMQFNDLLAWLKEYDELCIKKVLGKYASFKLKNE